MKWTQDQQRVINTRNCDLLVSAAAGSGKTAVLVERIIQRITDRTHPINIDELLVVTFTNAAAAQMREKLSAALYARLEENPTDEHLVRQISLIHRANISTIDSFCLQVVREHFQLLGIDPGFQIADQAELTSICDEVLGELLEETYSSSDKDFLAFIDCYGGDKSDQAVEHYMNTIMKKASSYSEPYKWLRQAREALIFTDMESVRVKPWYRKIINYTAKMLDTCIADAMYLRDLCLRTPELQDYAEKTCNSDISLLQSLMETVNTGSFSKICGADIKFKTAQKMPKEIVGTDLENTIKGLREKYKKTVSGLLTPFQLEEQELLFELSSIGRYLTTLLNLTEQYMRRVDARKLSEGMLDFSDIEHYAYRILVDENGPTSVAKAYQHRFKEIMIDEYQDSNYLQEDILSAISGASQGNNNMFMVGDVKQSIYRFRMARPDLFMGKYHDFTLLEDEADCEEPCQCRIELKSNFRSRGVVLNAVNYMFYQLMGADFGDVEYDEAQALVPELKFAEHKDCAISESTELLIFDQTSDAIPQVAEQAEDEAAVEMDNIEQEARMVAQRILEMVGERGDKPLYVLSEDGNSYRRACYRDIAILFRSVEKPAPVFLRVLMEYGIPVVGELSAGLMNTQEIRTLLACLSVIHNPNIDIDLVTVLHSPMFGFTNEELAQIRLYAGEVKEGKGQPDYNSALYTARETNPKISYFYELLRDWQKKSRYMDVASLLWEILEQTKYLLYLQALKNGDRRVANVYYLISCAKSYGANGRYSLYEFLQYISRLKDAKLDLGEANVHGEHDDIVRIMSMHKSKGLEYPIIFAGCLGRQFNFKDASENVIVHVDDFLASDYVDARLRMKKASFMNYAFKMNTRTETLEEEFRVLYVAMTRAKEKLVLTGYCKDLSKQIDSYGKLACIHDRRIPYGYRRNVKSFIEWILMALVRNPEFYHAVTEQLPEAGKLKGCDYVLTDCALPADFKLQVQVYHADDLLLADAGHRAKKLVDLATYYDVQKQPAEEELLEQLRERIQFQYPFEALTNRRAKYSVSELKAAGENDRQPVFKKRQVTVPTFMQPEQKLTGASRGTLLHRMMQLIDFSKCMSQEAIEAQLTSWLEQGMFSESEIEAISLFELWTFFSSDLGRAMSDAYNRGGLYREKPFTMLVPINQVADMAELDFDEKILVQGIIDAYYEQPDGSLVVVDYKTDQGSLPIEQYRRQLTYYAKALEQLTNKRVARCYIYWFTKNEAIQVYEGE